MDDVHPAYRGQGELQFLKIIAEEIEKAEYRPGTTFTKESERYVFRRFRTKLGPLYSDRFLRSRFKTIKKRYLEFSEMISKPGLYWDKKNNVVYGNEELLRAEYMVTTVFFFSPSIYYTIPYLFLL